MKATSILRRILALTLVPLLFVGIILASPKAYAGGKKKKAIETEETTSPSESQNLVIVENPEVPASWKKGEKAMYQTLGVVMRYPKKAADANQTGTAVVEFIIDAQGNASDFKIAHSTGFGALDKEAVRACQKALKTGWNPAMDNGVPVASVNFVPMRFSLR